MVRSSNISPIYHNRFYRQHVVGARTKDLHIADNLPTPYRTRAESVKEINRLLKAGRIVLILGLPGVGKSTTNYTRNTIKIEAGLEDMIPDFKNYRNYLMYYLCEKLGLPFSTQINPQEIREKLGNRAVILDDPEQLFDKNKKEYQEIYRQSVIFLKELGIKFAFISPLAREKTHIKLLEEIGIRDVSLVEMLPFNRVGSQRMAEDIAFINKIDLPDTPEFFDKLFRLTGGIAKLIKLLVVNFKEVGPDLKYENIYNMRDFFRYIFLVMFNLNLVGTSSSSLLFKNGRYESNHPRLLESSTKEVVRTYLRYGIFKIENGEISVKSKILEDIFFTEYS